MPERHATGEAVAASAVRIRPGKYDALLRRRSQRKQREGGCTIYIPLEELEKTGIDLSGPPPFYRVWGASRGRVVVQLYKAG